MVSPTFGAGSLTALVSTRSATSGSMPAEAVLFAVFGSNWSASVMVTVLVVGAGPVIRTRMVIESDSPLASDGIVHTLVVRLKLPRLGTAARRETPAGRVSVSLVFVAVSGPRLVTVTV